MREIAVEYMDISALKRWPRNPKMHDDDALSKSFDAFGFVDPIIVDERSKMIVSGHGRLAELERRKANGEGAPDGVRIDDGVWSVPVIRGVEFASIEDAERYGLAANRLVELGGFDERKLAALLLEHQQASTLDGTGYDEADVEELLERIGAAGGEPEGVEQNPGTASDVPRQVETIPMESAFDALPEGRKSEFSEMTFVVHADQKAAIARSIEHAIGVGPFSSRNPNKNGNALSRICETYLTVCGDASDEREGT